MAGVIERGSISSTVLYNVPDLSASSSELDSKASDASFTQRSAVPVLLSLLFSLFPQETQPHQGYRHRCRFVDHLTQYILQNITMLSLPGSLLLAAQSLGSSFCPSHPTGFSSARPPWFWHSQPFLSQLLQSLLSLFFPSTEKFRGFLSFYL